MKQDDLLEKIMNDEVPFTVGTMRGFAYDIVTEWYWSGTVVERKIPGTLPKPISSIIIF